ncbi:MAG TPA: TIGR03619 family F420-dependent LLM class oxidoreductase [Candidatus Dormibacteraeota bacterium]|nr:TIGR03619 family F420-dependent LLM class oxidoreductase [Candidatus Dormibacteraeota bacterium]
MDVGVVLPTYRRLASPANIVRAARLAEDLGFESVWTTDHVVVPAEQEDLFGRTVYDPLATLAYVAGFTSRVKLGVAVLVVPYRHPLPLAKTLATLDQLSGGRVVLGAGLGWLPGEFEALGLDVRRRASLTEDGLQAMRACWRSETPSHRGPHFAFDGVLFAPRPVGDLPVWIGGVSDAALERAARLGEGWISDGQTFEELTASLQVLDRRLAEAGRDRSGFTVALRTGLQVVDAADAVTASRAVRGHMGGQAAEPLGRTPFRGTADEVAADLAHASALGVDHLVFEFPIARGEESMDLFEPLAELRIRADV